MRVPEWDGVKMMREEVAMERKTSLTLRAMHNFYIRTFFIRQSALDWSRRSLKWHFQLATIKTKKQTCSKQWICIIIIQFRLNCLFTFDARNSSRRLLVKNDTALAIIRLHSKTFPSPLLIAFYFFMTLHRCTQRNSGLIDDDKWVTSSAYTCFTWLSTYSLLFGMR